jgi:transposase
LTLRDKLGTLYEDDDFSELYPQRGQPAYSPWRLALITILQFVENLSDRQAADAVRARIDWKYLLSLPLSDSGFDFSVLSEFRARLVEQEQVEQLLNRLLQQAQAQELLKANGKQRTDSTHVLAAIRVMNRYERVGETLRHALNVLATVAPE